MARPEGCANKWNAALIEGCRSVSYHTIGIFPQERSKDHGNMIYFWIVYAISAVIVLTRVMFVYPKQSIYGPVDLAYALSTLMPLLNTLVACSIVLDYINGETS
jgi:hypothetical protein